MKSRVAKSHIKREEGYLYYIKSNEEGYLEIWRTLGKSKKNREEKIKELENQVKKLKGEG